MTIPFHITGAYCSPTVGKPPITGLKWEINNRKPRQGIEIVNNPALVSKIQHNMEISQNDLINCHPIALTTKQFVKIGNEISAPIASDPLPVEKEVIANKRI